MWCGGEAEQTDDEDDHPGLRRRHLTDPGPNAAHHDRGDRGTGTERRHLEANERLTAPEHVGVPGRERVRRVARPAYGERGEDEP